MGLPLHVSEESPHDFHLFGTDQSITKKSECLNNKRLFKKLVMILNFVYFTFGKNSMGA